jgi:tRNA dimethylallyltransferase
LKPSPLLIIVGETASGKSALGLEVAEHLNGEIICADARTIYEGMDIGTAKATMPERNAISHYLIDTVKPNELFSAAQFKEQAETVLEDIASRGKLPIMVGGTGLYVDAVAYNFSFRPVADVAERERLNKLSIEELQAEITEKNLPMPVNSQNKRHLTRTIETDGMPAKRGPLRDNTLMVGLRLPREVLEERIRLRVDTMIAIGFIEEVRQLAEEYGWDAPGLQAPGYRAYRRYFENKVSLDEAKAEFVKSHLQLAKRQRTWFKRNPDINWFDNRDDAFAFILEHCRREDCQS